MAMFVYSSGTKNHNALDPLAKPGRPPRRDRSGGRTVADDDTIMAIMRRAMQGESVTALSREYGHCLRTVRQWAEGTAKSGLWLRVVREMERGR